MSISLFLRASVCGPGTLLLESGLEMSTLYLPGTHLSAVLTFVAVNKDKPAISTMKDDALHPNFLLSSARTHMYT